MNKYVVCYEQELDDFYSFIEHVVPAKKANDIRQYLLQFSGISIISIEKVSQ